MSNFEDNIHNECNKIVFPVQDALEMIKGKWKLPIIITLSFGVKRFNQILREMEFITAKMLSKELKTLEINGLIQREILNVNPLTIEYSLTEHSRSLAQVVDSLRQWGILHRKFIIDQCKKPSAESLQHTDKQTTILK